MFSAVTSVEGSSSPPRVTLFNIGGIHVVKQGFCRRRRHFEYRVSRKIVTTSPTKVGPIGLELPKPVA